jgi:hypothetical protein
VAILLALALLIAGASVALISALTYQHAVYSDPTSFSDALLKNLGVTREQAITFVRAHPDALFDKREVAQRRSASTTRSKRSSATASTTP